MSDKENIISANESQVAVSKVKPADLKSIINEVVEAPTSCEHIEEEEYKLHQASLIAEATKLAEQLFVMTNDKRETDLNLYLKTINDVVLPRNSNDNQFILKNLKSIFIKKYGEYIRKLGHNPELLEEIVHRTGQDTREIVAKTLIGFDVRELAAQIREKAFEYNTQSATIAARVMYDLTHQQVKELREEYNSLAAKELATILYKSLHRKDLRNENFPDFFTITYILKNRTKKEIAQIEFQYNEIYHFTFDKEKELCFREKIKSVFKDEELHTIFKLLEGFDADYLAEQISNSINNYNLEIEGLKELANVKIHNDFSTSLRKNRKELDSNIKEALAYSSIDKILDGVNRNQFLEVISALQNKYDINLNKELYKKYLNFNPREIVLNLYQACLNTDPRLHLKRDESYLNNDELNEVKQEFRLAKDIDLSQIIHARAEQKRAMYALNSSIQALSALLNLNPYEMYQVKESFLTYFGYNLKDFIDKNISIICRNSIPRFVDDLVSLLINGIGRQSVQIDIFELFANKAKRQKAQENNKIKESVTNRLPQLISLITKASENQNSAELFNFLKNFSLEELIVLEEISSRANSNPKPFLKGLEELLPADETAEIALLFKGIDCEKLCSDIFDNPRKCSDLLHLNAQDSYVIISKFHKIYGVSLQEHISTKISKDNCVLELLFALSSDALELRECFILCEEDRSHEHIALKILIKNKNDINLLEATYNRLFGRFRLSYEKNSALLLEILRSLASKQKISRLVYSKVINLLENVAIDVTENLFNIVTNKKITKTDLNKLQEILRDNSQNSAFLNKSYNALDLDSTLRERIYELEIPLDDINKTLLLLDGFSPELVADRLNEYIKSYDSSDLSNIILRLLNNKTIDSHLVIPNDPNWTEEMYYQVRKHYEHITESNIINDLIDKNVSLQQQGINQIAYLLYGETSLIAIKLYKLIKKEEKSFIQKSEEVFNLINSIENRLITRLVDFYNHYFTATGRSNGLIEDLKLELEDSPIYPKILKLVSDGLPQ